MKKISAFILIISFIFSVSCCKSENIPSTDKTDSIVSPSESESNIDATSNESKPEDSKSEESKPEESKPENLAFVDGIYRYEVEHISFEDTAIDENGYVADWLGTPDSYNSYYTYFGDNSYVHRYDYNEETDHLDHGCYRFEKGVKKEYYPKAFELHENNGRLFGYYDDALGCCHDGEWYYAEFFRDGTNKKLLENAYGFTFSKDCIYFYEDEILYTSNYDGTDKREAQICPLYEYGNNDLYLKDDDSMWVKFADGEEKMLIPNRVQFVGVRNDYVYFYEYYDGYVEISRINIYNGSNEKVIAFAINEYGYDNAFFFGKYLIVCQKGSLKVFTSEFELIKEYEFEEFGEYEQFTICGDTVSVQDKELIKVYDIKGNVLIELESNG